MQNALRPPKVSLLPSYVKYIGIIHLQSVHMTSPAVKKQKVPSQYELLYHPKIPGRGEYIRLAFEAAGVAYTDVANEQEDGYGMVQAVMDPQSTGDSDGNPPVFAPPALRVPGAGKDGKALVIQQTPNILMCKHCEFFPNFQWY